MAENKAIMPYDGNYTPLYGYDLEEEVYRTGQLVWDSDLLTWVKAKQGTLKTDSLTVEVDNSALITAIQAQGTMATANNMLQELVALKSLAIRVDEVSEYMMYVGEADPGTATSSPLWRIKKIDLTTGTIVTWADGNDNFDNVWDNRAMADYS